MVIKALEQSLKDASSADAAAGTLQAVAKVAVDGIGGPIASDKFGDLVSQALTCYRVSGGGWAVAATVTRS